MGRRVISGFKKAAVTHTSILLASVMFFSSPDSISAGNFTDASLDPGQELLGKFVATVSSSSVSFSYSYRIDDGKSEIRGDGTVKMQGSAYMVSGNGLEVYCDGTDRWTVDRNAREAVAELFDRDNVDIFSNPALMAVNADGFFTAVSESSVSSNGKDVVRTVLAPKSNTGRVSSAFIDFSVGDGIPVPVGAHLTMEDGSVLDISISGFECMPAGDISFFSFAYS